MKESILITGGLGYIGSHTVVKIAENFKEEIIIIDDLSNSKIEKKSILEKITEKKINFYEGQIQNITILEKIFSENKIKKVIHFAGKKSVEESVREPLDYYDNNVLGTINLLKTMKKNNVKDIVFSSSATVYGSPKKLPLTEDMEVSYINPYGSTKLKVEEILQDLSYSDREWSISVLRYFNPIGAHESGMLNEEVEGIPNNIMPYIIKVAKKELPYLKIFGTDYNTKDGTAIRDYIHVEDLAEGHIKAMKKNDLVKGIKTYNLGTGKGYSVKELVKEFEIQNEVKVEVREDKRREGDSEVCYASTKKAEEELDWKAEKTLSEMCRDSWNKKKFKH